MAQCERVVNGTSVSVGHNRYLRTLYNILYLNGFIVGTILIMHIMCVFRRVGDG